MTHRLEKKYTFNRCQYGKILYWLKTNENHYFEENEKDVIHSIYFDTPDFRFYEDNLSGNTERSKIRLRWYSNTKRGAVLELKNRYFDNGNKFKFNVDDLEAVNFLRGFNHKDANLDTKLINLVYDIARKSKISPILKLALKPSLFCTYKREYYAASMYDQRITMDYNIQYSAIGHKLTVSDNYCILETKSPVKVKNRETFVNQFPILSTAPRDFTQNYINKFHEIGLTQVRNSKYCTGISMLMENKVNKLKIEPYINGY